MRRALIVVVALLVAVVAIGTAIVLRHGGSGSHTVAVVGPKRITRRQLDLMVEHFHEEADAEGRPFPAAGTPQFTIVRRQALALLVARAQDEVAAAKLGIHVSEADVARAVSSQEGGDEEGGDVRAEAEAAFARGTAREQLVTERVFRKVTAGAAVSRAEAAAYYRAHRNIYVPRTFVAVRQAIESQLLSARKNARFRRWLAGARATPVKIEESSLKR